MARYRKATRFGHGSAHVLFNSEPYILFLGTVVALNWALPRDWRPAFLLAASYFFYAYWSPPYLALILSLTAFNYLAGILQGRSTPRRRGLLALAIAVDLAALGVFKYLGFLDGTVNSIAALVGGRGSLPVVQLILPLGLSFFTFEFVHYQIDLFRGTEPILNPIRFALFPAFFPTQIAGPIKRYEDFDEQVREKPAFNVSVFLEGLELIAVGLFKKAVIADTVARLVVLVYSHPGQVGAGDAWFGSLAWWIQIYFDFSAYSDIARGSAQLLGYRIPLNFNAPYLSRSFQNLWQRWHMSLSFWMRDYVFQPLVTARGLKRFRINVRLILAVMVTFALVGLWHGAAVHFVAFGLMCGLWVVVDRILEVRVWRRKSLARVRTIAVWAQTQLLILVTLVLFVVPVTGALHFWKVMFTGAPGFQLLNSLEVLQIAGIFGATVGIQIAMERWKPREWISRLELSSLMRPAYVASLSAVALYFAVAGAAINLSTQRFVYFQF
ncbi:MAG TPA: MBOAT family O-acyltransferase [Candidatus Dormibacteraeota bacterium]